LAQAGQIRMRQRFALVGEDKHDIAGLRLRPCTTPAADPRSRRRRRPASPSRCVAAGASGAFFTQQLGQTRLGDRAPPRASRSHR
jgi:hypothetical protein